LALGFGSNPQIISGNQIQFDNLIDRVYRTITMVRGEPLALLSQQVSGQNKTQKVLSKRGWIMLGTAMLGLSVVIILLASAVLHIENQPRGKAIG
jgi:type VI protein secretion system component VasF